MFLCMSTRNYAAFIMPTWNYEASNPAQGQI